MNTDDIQMEEQLGTPESQKTNADERTANGDSTTTDTKRTIPLRKLLRFYFSKPFKWEDYTCTFSIEHIIIFVVQLAKLFVISGQMLSYGEYNSNFAMAVHRGHLTLRHLLLENWDVSWETVPYPPANGDFAVYTINDLENGINYAVSGYHNADSDAAAFFKRLENDKMEVMINYFEFKDGIFGKEIIKSEKRFAIDHGLTNGTKDDKTEYTYNIAKELENLNISEAMQQMFETTLEFTLHSVRPQYENDEVLCLHITGKVHVKDMNYDGQIEVDLTTETHSIPCANMNLSVKDFDLENQNEQENPVICLCIVSAIISAALILSGVVAFRGHELIQSSLDKTVVWLGVGCVLVWLSFIRYLKINESFSNRHDKKDKVRGGMTSGRVLKQDQLEDFRNSLRILLNKIESEVEEETCLKNQLLQVLDSESSSNLQEVTSYKTLQSFLDDLEEEDVKSCYCCRCYCYCWYLIYVFRRESNEDACN